MIWFERLSETEIVLTVFFALYLLECVYWISHRAICFSKSIWSYRPNRPTNIIATEKRGFVLTFPAPFATSFICESWPVFVSPEGIYAPDGQYTDVESADSDGGSYISFHECHSIELLEGEVWVNGSPFATFASNSHAELFRECIDEISTTCQLVREEIIDKKLQACTDIDLVRRELFKLQCETARPKIASTILFVYTFGLGPALYYLAIIGPSYRLSSYLCGFVVCWLFAVFSFHSAHRRIYPKCGSERRKFWITTLFSPAAAMRGPSTLSRNLMAFYHPIAVAAAVCNRTTFMEFAKPFFLDLKYPRPQPFSSETTASSRTVRWFRDRIGNHLHAVLRSIEVDADDLVKAPMSDPDARSFCPRCHSQFIFCEGICEPCGGLRLKPFGEFLDESDAKY